MGSPSPVHSLAEYKVGAGEGAYMGTSEAATPPADVPGELARHEAEAAKEAPTAPAVSGANPSQPTPPGTGTLPAEQPIARSAAPTRDINAVARTIAPDTFKEYDGLAARRDEIRSQLSAETQKLQENAAAQAPHAAEIADLEQRLDAGTTPRLAKKYEERLATMRPDHDAFLQSDQFAMLTRDTDEMADMRQELQKADYRMRDLAPDVGAAYKQAQQQFPEAPSTPPQETHPTAAPGEPTPVPNVAAEEPATGAAPSAQATQPPASTPEQTPLQARYAEVSANEADLSRQTEAQRSPTFIADDVAQRLQAAGRPLEESQAAAALVQAHYEARADRFGGARGTAAEMYARDAPEVRGALAARATTREFAQGRTLEQTDITRQTETPEFKNWFGESKVVGENGEPLVVYHGSGHDIAEFDAGRGAQTTGNVTAVWGSFFTPDAKEASRYATDFHTEGQNITPVHLAISNPYEMTRAEWDRHAMVVFRGLRTQEEAIADERAFRAKLQADGHDGIVIKGRGFNNEYVAFNPEQIKSAIGNRGTFDPNSPRILEQGAQGKISLLNNGRKIITLMKDANASTFLHETGHAWLEELLSDAKDERAPDDLRRDAATVRDWLGAGADDTIKTAQHEKFARGFERYLMEGTAPSRALDRVFAQFRDWLTKIYQTVQKLRAPITDDIRDVFDRMLAKSPEPAVLAPEAASEVAPARPDVAPKIRTIQEIMEGERVSAARARRIQEQEIAARADYTSSAPEPSPEAKITGDLASLHESDAETTEPLHAAGMADQIQAEREEAARTHAPELSGGPTGGTEAEAGRGPGPGEQVRRPGGGDSTAGGSGGNTPELETVGARGGEAAAESRRPPEFAADAYPGAEPRYVDKAGNIRLELLTDDVAARAALKEEAELSGDFMNARRGVISDPQILDLADMINATGADLNIEKLRQMSLEDGVPMAARIKAGRKMLLQAEQAVREAAAGTDVMAFVNAGERLNMIQETVSGITAEWGRAGRAFRDLKTDTAGAQDIGAILEGATGRTLFQLRKQMQQVANLGTPGQVAKFSRDAAVPHPAGVFDWVQSAYINALLSGPFTHAGYTIAGEMYGLFRAAGETGASAMVGAVRRIMGADAKDAAHFGEIPHQLYGMYRGAMNGAKASWQAFKANEPVMPPEVAQRPGLAGVPMGSSGVIPGMAGTVLEAPSRLITALHTFNWTTFYSQSISAQAFRTAMEEGLRGDQFTNRIAALEQSPTDAMIQAASTDASQGALMQRPTYGSLMERVGRVTNWGVEVPNVAGIPMGTLRPIKFIEPFVQIAGNIQKAAFGRSTPLGLFHADVRDDLAMRNGGAAFDRTAGKMLAGTSFMIAAGSIAAKGLLNGSGPSDPKQAAEWRQINGQPHGLTVGNLSFNVLRMGVLGMQASVAADMWSAIDHMTTEDTNKVGSELIHAFTQNIMDESFMRGISDVVRAVDESDRYGAQWVRSFVSSAIPFSVGLSQVAREVDPYTRQARTTMDAILAKIPGQSQQLFPRYDVWGQPAQNQGWAGTYYTHIQNDPTEKALYALGVYPPMPKRDIRGVKLTDQQFDEYSRIGGRIAKQRLDAMVGQPGFASMPPGVQIKAIDSMIDGAREQARAIVMMHSAGSDNDIAREAIAKKRAQLTGQPK